VTAPGDVRVTASLLDITLTPKKADGSATDPPTMPLACTLNPGEDGHLVTVPVSKGSAPKVSTTASNALETTSPQADQARGIITGPGANSQAQIGGSPYDYINIPAIELCLDRFWATPQFRGRMQAYLAGYSNAKKLNSALTAGYPVPALVKGEGVATGRGLGFPHTVRTPDGHQYVCPSFEVDLDYQGRMELPPARATFLAFGFMPVTATAHISQVDREPLTGVVYRKSGASQQFVNAAEPFDIFTMAKMSLRLSDVTVNGVPLDVGSNCRTTEHLTSPDSPYRPDRLVMLGGSRENSPRPKFSYILSGGAMSGTVSIPNFTGCVTPSGEDLAPLLDATVSGDGNFMKMVLGPVCDGSNSVADFCMSPTDFRPSRVPYLYVSNGGPFSSTSEVTIESSGSSPLRITCPSVVASGAVPDASGPPRDSLGTLHLTFPPECAGSDGSRWQVSMQGTAHMAASWYNPAAKATNGKITDVSLLLSGTNVSGGGSCAAVTGGANLLTYTNPPEALLTLVAGARLQVGGAVLSDNCPGYFRSSSGSPANFYMSGVFDLKPANITVTSPHASEVVGP
jgi:hypothetical protein